MVNRVPCMSAPQRLREAGPKSRDWFDRRYPNAAPPIGWQCLFPVWAPEAKVNNAA
jgi:hypothetical protein